MKLYWRILKYFRPFAGGVTVASGLLIIAIGLNLLKPWPLKFVVDSILQNQTGGYRLPFWPENLSFLSAVGITCVALVLIHLLWGIFNLLNSYRFIDIGLRALLKLRTELYGYLQNLPLRFHDARRSGDSVYRVAYDAQSIQTFFNRGFATVLSSALMLAGAFVIMAGMNWKLTLVSLAVMPLLVLAIGFFAQKIRAQTAKLQQEESDILSRASEGLGGIRIVHAFGREKDEVQAFEKECRDSLGANLRLTLTHVASTLAVGMVVALGTAALLYVGAMEVHSARMSVGDLLVFLSYLTMLYQPLEQISYTAWAMEGATAGVQRVFEVLDAENDISDAPDAKPLPQGEGKIAFENVHFAYQPDNPVLRGIDFTIEPGQTVALVGGTGSGKTTVLSLIPRFYDPSEGCVRVNGYDVKTVKKESLRNQISMVLQETVLLNTTIRENIAYGRPGAAVEEIEEAARLAQAEGFIQKLPDGYETQVGERGVRLSVGQRQRIGIARAFLRNSPILLMDEPTSALDLETEAELMGALKNLMAKPTTLIVTHRLQTVHHADKIGVLENGVLVEVGTGEELLAKQGVYWRLWNSAR